MTHRQPQSDRDFAALSGDVHESRSALVKALLVAAGSICVVLGVVGIILPIVPTTPFLLLAAACYAHSSKRFYVALLTNRYVGRYIRDWRENRGLTLATKIWIIFVLAVTMGASALFFVPLMPVKISLGIIGLGVSTYIWRLPTKVDDPLDKEIE